MVRWLERVLFYLFLVPLFQKYGKNDFLLTKWVSGKKASYLKCTKRTPEIRPKLESPIS